MTLLKDTRGRALSTPLTHAVALGVLEKALHTAPRLAVEGALGVLAREARLAVVRAELTLVHIWHRGKESGAGRLVGPCPHIQP